MHVLKFLRKLITKNATAKPARGEFVMDKPSKDGVYTEIFSCQRKTIYSELKLDQIWRKLVHEVGNPQNPKYHRIAQQITGYDDENLRLYTDNIKDAVGGHNLMAFTSFNYSWMALFPPHSELKMKKLIIGNPVLAYEVLRHDPRGGLCLPVEVLLRERPVYYGGGCMLTWNLPSSGICGTNSNEDLLRAAQVIDEHLEALLKHVSQ